MSTEGEITLSPEAPSIVLEVTEAAREAVIGIRDQEDDAETLALRVEVTGINGAEYTYDLVRADRRQPLRATTSPNRAT